MGGVLQCASLAPACFADFIDFVIPEWQCRRAYKEAYAPGILRAKLFAIGNRLSPNKFGRNVLLEPGMIGRIVRLFRH